MFVENFNLSDMNLKQLLRWPLEVLYQAVVNLVDIGLEHSSSLIDVRWVWRSFCSCSTKLFVEFKENGASRAGGIVGDKDVIVLSRI